MYTIFAKVESHRNWTRVNMSCFSINQRRNKFVLSRGKIRTLQNANTTTQSRWVPHSRVQTVDFLSSTRIVWAKRYWESTVEDRNKTPPPATIKLFNGHIPLMNITTSLTQEYALIIHEFLNEACTVFQSSRHIDCQEQPKSSIPCQENQPKITFPLFHYT
ncbi:hypothetical protein FH972_015198 [Carpinus fangiana]|uniref:Uncharacterized protein n=1 Tax=Carpinus fangiana TaxID=176857 RepID=A0A5N6RBY5_9ROSI|nr:hypothetical protein FH972_015198 [Carpinus fangiana]